MSSIKSTRLVNYLVSKNKDRIRLGRGNSSGRGNTCGRGQKGQKSRSGHSSKQFFSGGQTPLNINYPKIGFKRLNIKNNYINTSPLIINYNYIHLTRLKIKQLFLNSITSLSKRYIYYNITNTIYIYDIYIGSYIE